MQITKQTVSGVEVFTVRGQLDATTSPQLETELLAGVQTGAKQFVVDLEQVSLISSAALRVLLSMAKRMRRQQGRILLCAPSMEVKKVFEVSDLSSLFDIYPTQADALSTTGGDGGSPAAPAPVSTPPVPVPATPAPAPAPVPVAASTPPAHVPPPSEGTVKPTLPVVQPTPVTGAAAVPPPQAPPAAPPKADPPPEDDGGETLIATVPAKSLASVVASAAAAVPAPGPTAPPSAAVIPPEKVATPAPAPAAKPSAPPVSPVLASAAPVTKPVDAAPAVSPPPSLPPSAPPTPPAAAVPPPSPQPKPTLAPPPKPAPSAAQPPPPLSPPPPAPTRPAAAGAPTASFFPFLDPKKPLVLAVALGVLALVVLGGATLLWRSLSRPKPPSPVSLATPTPAPRPTPAPTPKPVLIAPTPAFTPGPGPVARAAPTTPRAATPAPTAVVAAATPSAREEDARIVAPDRVNLDPAQKENQEVRASVLKRIELMPVSPRVKDQLYAAVDRAKRMGKVITITFGTGRTELSGADVEKLRQALQQPNVQDLVKDPTLIFVVLGYADAKGNEQTNLQLSERRAQKTLDVLRSSCGLLNVMHSIGMGGSDLFDKQIAERNRAVEVWAVLP